MRLFNRKAKKEQNTSTSSGTKRVTVARAWPPRVTRGDFTLKNSELLFSAISRISNALSAMPARLYKGTAPINNELNDLIGFAPNPNMTSCQFFKTLEACRGAYGNAYALKVMDAGLHLERLDVLDPSRVTPLMDEPSRELWYKVTPERGNDYYIHNYHMLHVPFISTNGFVGLNPVSVLLDTLGYSKDIQKFSVEQLKKGINAAVVLEAPANLGPEQQKEMVDAFVDVYKNTGGNILLLESGVTARALNLSPVDTKLFEVEKITRSKVAMVYNLPPHLLGDYSDASFSTMEQQTLEFLTLTMLPIVTAWEQELNKKLISTGQRKQGYNFKFAMDAMLRADAATTAEVNYKAVRSAWKTPNEIRAGFGQPPDKDGDRLFISRDMIPLDFLANNPGVMLGQKGDEPNGKDTEKPGNTSKPS